MYACSDDPATNQNLDSLVKARRALREANDRCAEIIRAVESLDEESRLAAQAQRDAAENYRKIVDMFADAEIGDPPPPPAPKMNLTAIEAAGELRELLGDRALMADEFRERMAEILGRTDPLELGKAGLV